MSMSLIRRLEDSRRNIWEQGKALLDKAEAEGRDLNADEQAAWTHLTGDLDSLDQRLHQLNDVMRREAETAETFRQLERRPVERSAARFLDEGLDAAFRRAILHNDRAPIDVTWTGWRSGFQPGIENRALTKASGSVIGTSIYGEIIRHLVEASAGLSAGARMLTTSSGETLRVPRTTAYSSAAIVSEGTLIGSSDPTYDAAVFSAYKYAFLVQITRELAEDVTFDLAQYLSEQAGVALANSAGAHFVTGTGSSQPTGCITGATLGVTGGAGVTGKFTADNLIDLYHSVAEPYARSDAAAWLMRNATLAEVRKLKDSSNRYLFDINAPAGSGASGTLLGRPVFVDPGVAAVAVSAKSVLFGDFSRYWVRQVNGIRFDRSDDYAFGNDLVTFRATWRCDGQMVDTSGALKYFQGNAA